MKETSVDMLNAVDWPAWVERWDRQQANYLVAREERFRLMFDYVERQRGGERLRLLDLCCGCGSISARAARRFPQATILAVDLDPWLVEMGRRTFGEDERVTWREADLRRREWAAELQSGGFDAVLTATALHWFRADDLVRLYGNLAGLLAEGGLFLNADHMPTGHAAIDTLSAGLVKDWKDENFARPGAEDWMAYWEAARAELAFAELLAERDRRFADRPPAVTLSEDFHRQALLAAGFRQAAAVWRSHEDAIMLALR